MSIKKDDLAFAAIILAALLMVFLAGCGVEDGVGAKFEVPSEFYIDARFPHPEMIPQILAAAKEINDLCPGPALVYGGISDNGGMIDYANDNGHIGQSVLFATDGPEKYIFKGDTPEQQVLGYETSRGSHDCDIYLFNFTHNFIDGRSDYPPEHRTAVLKTVVLHEMLHCVGVEHSADPQDVMFPSHSVHMQAVNWYDGLSSGDIDAFYAARPECMMATWVNR